MAPVGVNNGNFRSGSYLQFSQAELNRPTDKVLQFIKANTDGETYRARFNKIYDAWRNTDYKRYMAELVDWRNEIAAAQAENGKRETGELIKIQTGHLDWTPAHGKGK